MGRNALYTVYTVSLILSGAAGLIMLFFRSDISDTYLRIVGSADMIALVCLTFTSIKRMMTIKKNGQ